MAPCDFFHGKVFPFFAVRVLLSALTAHSLQDKYASDNPNIAMKIGSDGSAIISRVPSHVNRGVGHDVTTSGSAAFIDHVTIVVRRRRSTMERRRRYEYSTRRRRSTATTATIFPFFTTGEQLKAGLKNEQIKALSKLEVEDGATVASLVANEDFSFIKPGQDTNQQVESYKGRFGKWCEECNSGGGNGDGMLQQEGCVNPETPSKGFCEKCFIKANSECKIGDADVANIPEFWRDEAKKAIEAMCIAELACCEGRVCEEWKQENCKDNQLARCPISAESSLTETDGDTVSLDESLVGKGSNCDR